MATCANPRCRRKYKMNWMRYSTCKLCRLEQMVQMSGRMYRGRAVIITSTQALKEQIMADFKSIPAPPRYGARVTFTFELSPTIDTDRFVQWLRDEVAAGNDYEGITDSSSVKILSPVTVDLYGDGK